EAFVTRTHNTSREVFVKAVTENLVTGDRKVCTTAFLTFVAVDENGRPVPVPPVYPESDQEKKLHEEAAKRAELRRERRQQSKQYAEEFGTDYPWNHRALLRIRRPDDRGGFCSADFVFIKERSLFYSPKVTNDWPAPDPQGRSSLPPNV